MYVGPMPGVGTHLKKAGPATKSKQLVRGGGRCLRKDLSYDAINGGGDCLCFKPKGRAPGSVMGFWRHQSLGSLRPKINF